MAVADIASGALPEDVHRSQLRRAIIASTVGTTIEWYDFPSGRGLLGAKGVHQGP
jgi:hypothetical protein